MKANRTSTSSRRTATSSLEPPALFPSVIKALKKSYSTVLKPLEKQYDFETFHSPSLRDSDFDAKPMVLLIGQYSTGKTSFIEYMLERQFPGQRVGPEPTTDRFVAVMWGGTDRVIPGSALSVAPDKPFYALNSFGQGFLSKLEASECDSPLLHHVTFIDTPGVLSGEKQSMGRAYDYVNVCEWFAERSDLILLLFDAHKLDISDEFKSVIEILKGHDDKIRVVLNKADSISTQQLMRVYGALMWALGKVVKTPEVMRVYIGTFWNQPLQIEDNKKLFDAEQKDLISDLQSLPKNSAVRKVNEFVKRAKLLRVHMLIIGTLKSKMPSLFGKESAKQGLIDNLVETYKEIKRVYHLPASDFPSLEKTQEALRSADWSTFPSLDLKLVNKIDVLLTKDVPAIMMELSPAESETKTKLANEANPFGGESNDIWEIGRAERRESHKLFDKCAPDEVAGRLKVSGAKAKPTLQFSGLDTQLLRKIWDLSDIDKDGYLDLEEWTIAMHLIKIAKKEPRKIPQALPPSFIPASKRGYS